LMMAALFLMSSMVLDDRIIPFQYRHKEISFWLIHTDYRGIFQLLIGAQAWCSLLALFLGLWILTEFMLEPQYPQKIDALWARRILVARIGYFLLVCIAEAFFEKNISNYFGYFGYDHHVVRYCLQVADLVAIFTTLPLMYLLARAFGGIIRETGNRKNAYEFYCLMLMISLVYLIYVFHNGLASERLAHAMDSYMVLKIQTRFIAVYSYYVVGLWTLCFCLRMWYKTRQCRKLLSE